MQPAFWVLKQLHGRLGLPDHYLNFRAIVNLEEGGTKVLYNQNIKLEEFKAIWNDNLFERFLAMNSTDSQPANIYFGVNPRLSPFENKKLNCPVYHGFYLDLDDNKAYTRELRLKQIQFWISFGLPPSFIIDSGHGFHCYWLLSAPVQAGYGQEILKRMVALTGCKDKGNTHDPTRVLRLPGFLNVKEWWKNDKPMCSLFYPEDWQSRDITSEDPAHITWHYPVEQFQFFPPSETADILRYEQHAAQIPGDQPFAEKIKQLAQAAGRATVEQSANLHGQAVAQENIPKTIGPEFVPPKAVFVPTSKTVPALEDIKWGKNRSWMKTYCIRGFQGLNPEETQKISQVTEMNPLDASSLDMKVIYFLVRSGYTFDAVEEFWRRSDLKLFRENKDQKNPNYLSMSYNKALEQVQAAVDQDGKLKAEFVSLSKIFVDNRNTYIQKGDSRDLIVTCEMILKAKYWDEDASTRSEKEWLVVDCLVNTPSGPAYPIELSVPGKAFASIPDFKTHVIADFVRCPSTNNGHLQYLIRHLEDTYSAIPRHRFHSKLSYRDKMFIFPKYVVKETEIELRDTVLTAELAKKYAVHGWFSSSFLRPEEIATFLEANWNNLLHYHLPRVVISLLGFIATSAMRQRFEADGQETDEVFSLPSLNIRGGSHSGKSSTVRKFCSLAGIIKGRNMMSLRTSEFAMAKTIETAGFVPLVVDEFKANAHNQKHMDNMRDFVRRIYSGEQMGRGTKQMGTNDINVVGAIIVVGEHSVENTGDVSEVSRVIPIDTDEYEPDKHTAHWREAKKAQYQKLSPYFYQFLLSLEVHDELAAFEILERQIETTLAFSHATEKVRIAHNLATLWYGCRLWDRFVRKYTNKCQSIEETLNPCENLVEYIKAVAKESGHTILMKNEGANPLNQTPVASNELFKMLATFSEMILTKDRILEEKENAGGIYTHDWAETTNDIIHINLGAIWLLVREKNNRVGDFTPPKNKIFALAKAAFNKKEPWINDYDKTLNRGGSHKVIAINVKAFQNTNILDGIIESAQKPRNYTKRLLGVK